MTHVAKVSNLLLELCSQFAQALQQAVCQPLNLQELSEGLLSPRNPTNPTVVRATPSIQKRAASMRPDQTDMS